MKCSIYVTKDIFIIHSMQIKIGIRLSINLIPMIFIIILYLKLYLPDLPAYTRL